jgi:hypothetical protein
VNRTLRHWWCAGFFVAWDLYSFWWFFNRGTFGQFAPDVPGMFQGVTIGLWPSCVVLAPLSGNFPLVTAIAVAVSLVLNGFIYVGIGYVHSKVFGRRPVPPPV